MFDPNFGKEEEDRTITFNEKPNNFKISYWELFKNNVFFFYDGVAFFGFADYKLKRLKGNKPTYCDKFSTKHNIVMYLMAVSIVGWVMYNNLNKIGTIKT